MIKELIGKFKNTNPLLNALFVYILANGIGQGTTLLANIFFTRYMSQRDYGFYSNYYSYVAILVPFVGMNLYYGLANAYMDYKQEIHKFRSSVLLLSGVGWIITTMALITIKNTIGFSMSIMCILLMVAHAYGFFLVNYYIQSMNMENRFIAKGLMFCIPNILQALFAAVAVIICNNYISRIIGGSLGVVSCGVVAASLIIKAAKPEINTEYWKYVLRISLPAIIGSVSAMIMQQCDKVMITYFIGAEETAVYALIYNIGYILYAVQQATSGVWQVWLYNTLERKEYSNISNAQKWYMFVLLVLATVLYMVAPEIVKILAPKDYWQLEYVVPFVIGSYLMLMYSLHMSVIEYNKKTGVNSIIVSVGAVINIVLNYLLIPQYGGIGAAYTSVVSYIFIFIVSGIYLSIHKEYYFRCATSLIGGVFVVAIGIVFHFVRETILMRYTIFVCILTIELFYVLRNKDKIMLMIKNEKNNENG